MLKSEAISFYDTHAGEFARRASDLGSNSFEYTQNWPVLQELVNGTQGYVLDFGCGDGSFTKFLVHESRVIDCCDGSSNLLEIAKKNLEGSVRECFLWDGIEELRSDRKYDLILAKLVFHYIENVSTVAQSMYKHLKPGGKVVVSVPHPDKTQKLLTNPDAQEEKYMDEIGDFGLKTTMFHRTQRYYVATFDGAGFDLERVSEVTNEKGEKKRLNMLFLSK